MKILRWTLIRILTSVTMGASALAMSACSSPPPPQSPTTQGVRADSDRFFEKVKQEEKAKQQDRPAEGSGY